MGDRHPVIWRVQFHIPVHLLPILETMSDERKELKKFILKFSIFAAPFAVFTMLYLIADPFRVLRPYDDYYKDSNVEPCRDFVATELFLKHRQKNGYDSFILGNSRSRAFECSQWLRYEPDAKCFHFAANRESLFGIWAKIKLIDQTGTPLRRALLILDPEILAGLSDSQGHLFIKHPVLSKRSWPSFQLVFLAAYYEDLFFIKFTDFYLFHRWRPYMRGLILQQPLQFDPVTNDDLYGLQEIKPEEVEKYYADRKNIFFERRHVPAAPKQVIRPESLRMLKEIRQIMEHHGTRFKIIISPLYDQIPFNRADLQALQDLFGVENVFDFSGVNDLTQDVHNFMEPFHYWPKVAREILRRIYSGA